MTLLKLTSWLPLLACGGEPVDTADAPLTFTPEPAIAGASSACGQATSGGFDEGPGPDTRFSVYTDGLEGSVSVTIRTPLGREEHTAGVAAVDPAGLWRLTELVLDHTTEPWFPGFNTQANCPDTGTWTWAATLVDDAGEVVDIWSEKDR